MAVNICSFRIGRLSLNIFRRFLWLIFRVDAFQGHLLGRNIFRRHRIGDFIGGFHLLDVIQICIDNIDFFSFILCKSFDWDIHLLMNCSIVALIRKYFSVPYLVGKIGVRRSNNFRFVQPLSHLSQLFNFSISFVLDNTQILPLLNFSFLLSPPFPSFLKSGHHIILGFYICQITKNGKQFFMRCSFILIRNKLIKDSFVVEGNLMSKSSKVLLIFEEGI